MKTIRILLTVMIMGSALSLSAQMGTSSIGIRAGVNFQNLNGKDANNNNLENKLKPGFNIGVNADIPIAEDFYVEPGLLYTTKGAKSGSDKINLSYLEIPINLLYKPVLGEGRLLLGFGPYAAIGLGGKLNDTKVTYKNEISPAEAASGSVYLRRADAGANLLAGYEFASKFSAQLNAQLGLVNINPDISGVSDNGTLKNTGFGVSLGYRF